ncbi:TIGR00730 family Rossman fold protein [Acetobacteraceae bacterium ESL0709]|nr:TIGR00730 family Rossman fold protein [Acetobacteraceae bacterium ESL0697]MDF7678814.1 TIGR00730 family Rossman fold protein [Acetobacteraceae bacterium ESL0709]
MTIEKCTVFCGSRDGNSPVYTQAARELGHAMAKEKLALIYGGGAGGMMGTLARTIVKAGGHVKGITTSFLEEQELRYKGLSDLEIVADMPTRKKALFELGDVYIILPGGFGTFDEFMEVLVNRQLNLHKKPIFILNTNHWADPLLALMEATIQQAFAPAEIHTFYTVVENVPALIKALKSL